MGTDPFSDAQQGGSTSPDYQSGVDAGIQGPPSSSPTQPVNQLMALRSSIGYGPTSVHQTTYQAPTPAAAPASLGAPSGGGFDSLSNAAKSYLGTPYVYGGTGRNGVDCSGFTQAVFQQAYGKNIGRTTGDQFNSPLLQGVGQDGNWNSAVNSLRAGDLIYYGQPGASGPNAHVVMYLGNGQVIQAPYTGAKVSITGLFPAASANEPFLGVRRFRG